MQVACFFRAQVSRRPMSKMRSMPFANGEDCLDNHSQPTSYAKRGVPSRLDSKFECLAHGPDSAWLARLPSRALGF